MNTKDLLLKIIPDTFLGANTSGDLLQVLFESLLTAWGCEVRSFAGLGPLRASGQLATWQPSVLVVDYHLDAGETGLDVVRQLRHAWAQQAPALMVSADANEQVRAEAEAEGCGFLRKPLRPLALRSALRRLLQHDAQALRRGMG
jgi:CheY-like chemotaxis protein